MLAVGGGAVIALLQHPPTPRHRDLDRGVLLGPPMVDQRYRFEGVVVGDRMIGHWWAEQDPSIEVPMTGRRRVL